MTVGERVEKQMTLSLTEFQGSIRALTGGESVDATTMALSVGQGSVWVSYEPLPPARFGGLLVLPRGRVVLAFQGVAAGDREAFVKRFDFCFQRGGG